MRSVDEIRAWLVHRTEEELEELEEYINNSAHRYHQLIREEKAKRRKAYKKQGGDKT